MASLESSFAKLRRAKEHFDLLKDEIVIAKEPVLGAVLAQATCDPETGKGVVRIIEAPAIPPRLSAIVGDFVHNLRSALDHLAYQVTALHPDGPYPKSQWPIVSHPDKLNTTEVFKETLALFGSDELALVKRHQPYSTVKALDAYLQRPVMPDTSLPFFRDTEPLAWIRDFSNVDKHSLLLDAFVIPSAQTLRLIPVRDCTDIEVSWMGVVPLKKDAEVAGFHATITGTNPHVRVDFNFAPEIGIECGRDLPTGVDALNALELMAAKVVQIVREFEPSF